MFHKTIINELRIEVSKWNVQTSSSTHATIKTSMYIKSRPSN